MLAGAVAVVGSTGCLWSDFDDLQGDVWVDRVGAVEGSSKFGDAVMEASAPGPAPVGGALVAVVGRMAPTLSRLSYGADGSRDVLARTVTEADDSVVVLDENAVHASDPASEKIAIAALSGAPGDGNRGLHIIVYSGFAAGGPPVPSRTKPEGETTGVGEPPTAMAFISADELLVGRRGKLQYFDLRTQNVFTECLLLDPAEAPFAIAIADADADGDPDYIVATAKQENPQPGVPEVGRVWITPADVAIFGTAGAGTPCPAPAREIADGGGIALSMDIGSEMAVADFGSGPRAVVSSGGATGKTTIIDFTQASPAATQIGTPFADSLWVEDLGGRAGPEIIVGMPHTEIDGKTNAGLVRIYDGAGATQAELYDPNSSTEQNFGRSVVVAPFGSQGKKVLLVGAEEEVFTYFRTTLYDEVRTNR